MGNQHSSDGVVTPRSSRPFSSRGALGLSKSELEKRCQPSGLYESCQWEDKAIRRLIGDGKIAARLKGNEVRGSEGERECPICFLNYTEINITKCCKANLCTECYLQVRPQKEKHSSCPFCNHTKLHVGVAKQLEQLQIQEREEEEQRVIEARIRERSRSVDGQDETDDGESSPTSGFGSSLEKNTMVARMRARSESMNEQDVAGSGDVPIKSLAMTPEERRALEDEMRAQHTHPLALRVEAEAEERRLRNEREYYRAQNGRMRDIRAYRDADMFLNGGSSSSRRNRLQRMATDSSLLDSRRGPGGRDWNQIVDAFERGGNGEIQSLDDLVVLEAAIVLSMEEEQRRNRGTGGEPSNSESFDAARHARDGFPLVRNLLSSHGEDGPSSESSEQMQQLARNLSSARRNRRNQLLRASSASTPSSSGMNTASLMMRGMSEEEQLALAIAASLQDQAQSNSGSNNGDGDGGSGGETNNEQTEVAEGAIPPVAVGIIMDDNDGDDGGGDRTTEESIPSSDTSQSAGVPSGSGHGAASPFVGDNNGDDEAEIVDGAQIAESERSLEPQAPPTNP